MSILHERHEPRKIETPVEKIGPQGHQDSQALLTTVGRHGEQLDELDRFHARWQPDPTPTPTPPPVEVITPEGDAHEPGDTGPGATIYPFRRLRERPEREAR